MFRKMKVCTKIAGGFIIVLALTVIIGTLSVYYMSGVGKIINRLSTHEIPETSAVVEIEREMWNTHVLSYEFDIKADEQSKKEWFDQREQIGKAIDKIVPIATALNHQETLKAANEAKQGLSDYAKIGEKYTAMAMENKGIEKQLERNAIVIEKQWVDYINGQNEKIQRSIEDNDFEDVVERVGKLRLGSEGIDIYNLIRKNEYLYIMHQRRENADILHDNLGKLMSLTKDTFSLSSAADDVKRKETALEYSEKYKKLVDTWTENKKKQAELLKQSDAAAMGIIDLSIKTAVQADKDVYDIGMQALQFVAKVKMIFIVLLIGAILIGSALAFFITRGITKPLNRVIEGLNEGADQVASASGQVSSSSQQPAEGASEQAASIEETSSSLEEMSSMTIQNAANSEKSASASEEMDARAEQMKSYVKELVAMVDGSKNRAKHVTQPRVIASKAKTTISKRKGSS